MSLLDRDHHEGNLLDRIAQLEAQLEALERAVAMGLFAPGSTTMSITSTDLAVPRPRCSRPASMSMKTTSSSSNRRWSITLRRRVDSGQ